MVVSDPKRWWVLAVAAAAQFVFVVDAFIVNVAIPAIRADLGASSAEIAAVIAIYQIAYATVVITGGRLGDLLGRRRMFITGVLGFTFTSLLCGLAPTPTALILARLAQGAMAALMVPQVLATIHVLFPDAARARAFAVFGMTLGLGGACGFLAGGTLVSLNLAGLGWRAIFLVNLPIGLVIAALARRLMPDIPARPGVTLDIAGAATLFAALVCLVGPVLFGADAVWASWLWVVAAAGVAIMAIFVRIERATAERGGMPVVDLLLFADRGFRRRLAALMTFHFGNTSFYLVMTLFAQGALGFSAFEGGLMMLPLAVAFVAASRIGAARAARRGMRALVEGCVVQEAGLIAIAALVFVDGHPGLPILMAMMTVFGIGQGLVMAPLFGAVLADVPAAQAGAAAGVLATAQQVAAAAGISVAGAVYFDVQPGHGAQAALADALGLMLLSVVVTSALLHTRQPRTQRRVAAGEGAPGAGSATLGGRNQEVDHGNRAARQGRTVSGTA